MKVLFVEDDIPLNKTIKSYLELKHYDVTSFTDGEDALIAIDTGEFDFYILDINIPNIDGLELTKYIRKKDTKSPILIITASLEINNFLKAFNNGSSEYIKKPFHLKELEIRIDHLLNRSDTDYVELSKTVKYNNKFEEAKGKFSAVLQLEANHPTASKGLKISIIPWESGT